MAVGRSRNVRVALLAGAAILAMLRRRRAQRPPSVRYSVLSRGRAEAAKSFLVTGGTGTLGARLLKELSKQHPDSRLVSLDLCAPADDRRVDGVVYIIGSASQQDHVEQAIDEARSGGAELVCVFHQAGMLPSCSTTLEVLHHVNARSSADVAKACLGKGVGRLVYTSSISTVMDIRELIIDGVVGEERPYPEPQHLVDDYARSKQAGERAVLSVNGCAGASGQQLTTCAIRPAIIFDGRDRKLMQNLIQGRNNAVFSGGAHVVDFVWAVDVARAHVAAYSAMLERPADVAGKAFHIGGGKAIPTKEWFGMRNNADPSKSIWGNGQPRDVPFGLIVFLAYFNYYIYLATSVAPIDVYMRPDSIRFMGGRSWWWSIREARRALDYEPTAIEDIARAVRAEEDLLSS